MTIGVNKPDETMPVGRGGTGHTTGAAALQALGGISPAAHASLDHSLVTGVPKPEQFTSAKHDRHSHRGVPGVGSDACVWFATNDLASGIFLAPYGSVGMGNFRAPRDGTITRMVYDGDGANMQFLVNGLYRTGVVNDGRILTPGLAVKAGQIITVQLVAPLGSGGSRAAFSMLIE